MAPRFEFGIGLNAECGVRNESACGAMQNAKCKMQNECEAKKRKKRGCFLPKGIKQPLALLYN